MDQPNEISSNLAGTARRKPPPDVCLTMNACRAPAGSLSYQDESGGFFCL